MATAEDVRRAEQRLAETNRRLRRTEERVHVKHLDLRWQLAKMEAAREQRGVSLQAALQRQRQIVEVYGIILDAPQVARFRQHVAYLIHAHHITVRWDVLPAGQNAYASPLARWVELAPIINGELYATALHEVGHIANPCLPTHQRRRTKGIIATTVCCRCEISAWRWALDVAIEWTADMHRLMKASLESYFKYGDATERAEMRTLSSPPNFRRVQLACTLREAS